MAGKTDNARDLLLSQTPANSPEYAGEVAHKYYGIKGKVRELNCERDQILMLEDTRERRFILRFINPVEPTEVSDFQTRVLLHVAEADPELPVPRVVPALDGAGLVAVPAQDGRTCAVRLITCVPGITAVRLPAHSRELRRDMGSKLARLDLALGDFPHPVPEYDLPWDVQRLGEMQDLFTYIRSDELRELAAAALDGYRQKVLPLLPCLRRQIIHNDLNLTNVMVDADKPDRVTGIIDFGDMLQGPLVNEVAISLYYQVDETRDSFRQAGHLLASYHRILPLEAVELDILYDLMLARGALSTTIMEWRITELRRQGRYSFVNYTSRQSGLYRVAKLGRDKVQNVVYENSTSR